jgi:arylsulfatase A-like enzyme
LTKRLREAGLEGKNKENLLWLDDALGALRSKLEQYGLMNNTIIFFFNDHGQHAKGTLYQGGLQNPSIIWKSGGFDCGKICEAKVSNVDFAPTILEYAGLVNAGNNFDGKSFKSALEGKSSESRESLYFELGYARAVIKGNYKYLTLRYPEYAVNMTREERQRTLDEFNAVRESLNIPRVNSDPGKPFGHLELTPGGGGAEHAIYGKKPGFFDPDQLYDLKIDPNEMNNLANDPEYQEKLNELKSELRKYVDALPGEFYI